MMPGTVPRLYSGCLLPFLALAIGACVAVTGASAWVISHTPNRWNDFVAAAAERHGEPGRRAAEFLRTHRPDDDAELDLELLSENLLLALEARAEFDWARALPEEIFLNDVLPYAVLDETRDRWRPEFLAIGREIVADATSATDAAQALNREIFNRINVHYNTGRKKPNQSPAESIVQGRATCTGLSIILVDACRAVGVPARVAGVASWNGKDGNHTWVEIWDGTWSFLGADEYDANGVNRAWFAGDAANAISGDPLHAVWASSWRDTGTRFPMAWDMMADDVSGVDVTARYTMRTASTEGKHIRHFRVWDTAGGERLAARVRVVDAAGAEIADVMTRAGTADLNDMPAVAVSPGAEFHVGIEHGGHGRMAMLTHGDEEVMTMDLCWDQLAEAPTTAPYLSRDDAESLVAPMWRARADAIANERRAEIDAAAFVHGDRTLRIKEKSFGDAVEGTRSLWISLHGGGGAPAEVNDKQWNNQTKLYEPAEGIYIAPRAPTDTWNLWHQGHIDHLFDRLIETYVATRGVDPNRVYLLGYSAGGDGVFQLSPRFADRLAAASMMAGHPNDTSPLGLRNLPFEIFMGGEDSSYNRNGVAAEWKDTLAQLAADDPGGYPHRVTIYPDLGHWMDGKDAEALPRMAEQTRNPWPKRIVWRQDDVTHTRFYWLSVHPDDAVNGRTIIASVDGQTIRLESKDVNRVTLRLRDALLDLDQPIIVEANGVAVFEGVVRRNERAIRTSLQERADPASAATALLSLSW